MGVSGKSIDYATKVLNNAIPEVVKAMDEGRMGGQHGRDKKSVKAKSGMENLPHPIPDTGAA